MPFSRIMVTFTGSTSRDTDLGQMTGNTHVILADNISCGSNSNILGTNELTIFSDGMWP